MTLRHVSGPTELPISVEAAKGWLRVDHDLEDALIESLVRAALAHAETWCAERFAEQTWEQVLDEFPASEIDLGMGPVMSVTSVQYVDADGVTQTVDAADYVVDTVSDPGWVVPVSGFTWPTTMETIHTVTIRFVVGADNPLPPNIVHALRMMVAHWYAHREDATPGELKSMPTGAQSILNLHRTLFV